MLSILKLGYIFYTITQPHPKGPRGVLMTILKFRSSKVQILLGNAAKNHYSFVGLKFLIFFKMDKTGVIYIILAFHSDGAETLRVQILLGNTIL